jgi:hypothetical protein
MRNLDMKRGSGGGRHDFDSLPNDADVEVRGARPAELPILADMACRLIPGIDMPADVLSMYLASDPETILSFSRRGKLLGAMAFLYLNDRGHDALLLDEICLARPEMKYLAAADEEVSAIYIWALAMTGRGSAGYGKAAEHLRKPRYARANIFAQPATKDGRGWLSATCFEPIQSFQPDLWCYERSWKRPSMSIATAGWPIRSCEDARH